MDSLREKKLHVMLDAGIRCVVRNRHGALAEKGFILQEGQYGDRLRSIFTRT